MHGYLTTDGDPAPQVLQLTRKVLNGVLDAQRSRSDGQISACSVDSALRSFWASSLRSIARALKAKCPSTPLLSLPLGILELICRPLPLVDRISLSHCCWDLRGKLLSIAAIWQDLNLQNTHAFVPLGTRQFDRLQDLIDRSANHSELKLAIVLAPDTLSVRGNELRNTVGRLTSLNLVIGCSDNILTATLSGPTFWNATLDAFSVPAPRLKRLSLSVITRDSSDRAVPFDEDDEPPAWYIASCSLPLSSTLFACHAPLLRACSLQGVSLPALGPESGAFRHITSFNFSQNLSIHVDEVARILTLLPALISLGLSAAFLDDHARSYIAQSPAGHLENLVLHADSVAPSALCEIIDFGRLGYLEICPGFQAGDLIAEAYPDKSIELVVLRRKGVKVVVEGTTTVHVYYPYHGLHPLLLACSRVTQIALHEFEWTPQPATVVLALPAVTSLCVRMATCAEHARQVFLASIGYDTVGIFQAAWVWELTALRQLHITAPYSLAGTCGYDSCRGRCLLSDVSISLRDVAVFVRDCIQFGARKLDEIQLSGLRVADMDALAAQDEVLALAERLLLEEVADPMPCMDVPRYEDLPNFVDRFAEES